MLIICPGCDRQIDAHIFKDGYGKEIETAIECKDCSYKERYWFKIRRIEYKNLRYQINENGEIYSNTHISLSVLRKLLIIKKWIAKWTTWW